MTVRLHYALLCAQCSVIYETWPCCPICGSQSFLNLAKLLGEISEPSARMVEDVTQELEEWYRRTT